MTPSRCTSAHRRTSHWTSMCWPRCSRCSVSCFPRDLVFLFSIRAPSRLRSRRVTRDVDTFVVIGASSWMRATCRRSDFNIPSFGWTKISIRLKTERGNYVNESSVELRFPRGCARQTRQPEPLGRPLSFEDRSRRHFANDGRELEPMPRAAAQNPDVPRFGMLIDDQVSVGTVLVLANFSRRERGSRELGKTLRKKLPGALDALRARRPILGCRIDRLAARVVRDFE